MTADPSVRLRTPAERARHWSKTLIALHDEMNDAPRSQKTTLMAAAIGLSNLADELDRPATCVFVTSATGESICLHPGHTHSAEDGQD